MNLLEQLHLEQKIKSFCRKSVLEKKEKPPFVFGFCSPVSKQILEHSSSLFPVKAFRLWNMVIFETSEKNIWTKGIDPLWTKALFIIIILSLIPLQPCT